MKLWVLGSSGAELPDKRPPGFLIDDKLMLDAGTIGSVLNENEQWGIKEIFLTHAHLDHIKGIPFMVDNIILQNTGHQVKIRSTAPILAALHDNLLNNVIWPDFTEIPDKDNAVLVLEEIQVGKPYDMDGYQITAWEVNHTVPAVGYVVEDPKGRRLLYTGDTGPTDAIWEGACKQEIHAAIIEASMPNHMRDMAIMTGHLTPDLLNVELTKMQCQPDRILITHPKPQYIDTISKELRALRHKDIELLRDGEVYEI